MNEWTNGKRSEESSEEGQAFCGTDRTQSALQERTVRSNDTDERQAFAEGSSARKDGRRTAERLQKIATRKNERQAFGTERTSRHEERQKLPRAKMRLLSVYFRKIFSKSRENMRYKKRPQKTRITLKK